MRNPYQPIMAKVDRKEVESPAITTFGLVPEKPVEFQAGQFVEVTVQGIGEAPFTPSSSPYEKGRMDVTIMNVGRVTSTLHEQIKVGDSVGIRGPLGNPYPLDEFKGQEILIVGGGVGLAPLRALFLSLTHDLSRYKKITFCCGCKTPQDYIYKGSILQKWPKEFSEKVCFRITVDKGDADWQGKVGLVTTTLDGVNEEIEDLSACKVVVCGPPIMMKFTTFKLLEIGCKDSNIYLSMEKNMSCGIGKCGHCMMGPYYACKDGPVFTYDKIKDLPNIWD